MKIEKTRSVRPCIVCGQMDYGDIVIHFTTVYGYQFSYYVAMHVKCLPLLNAKAVALIKSAPERFKLKLDPKVIGGLRVAQT